MGVGVYVTRLATDNWQPHLPQFSPHVNNNYFNGCSDVNYNTSRNFHGHGQPSNRIVLFIDHSVGEDGRERSVRIHSYNTVSGMC